MPVSAGLLAIPAGGRLFACLNTARDGSISSTIRRQMPGQEPTSACHRAGPTFISLAEAEKWIDAKNGGPAYRYPEGAA